MKQDTGGWRIFLRTYWLPLLAFAALCVVTRDSDPKDGRVVADLFSDLYYKIYIAVSVVVLVVVAIRRHKMRTIFWGLELTLFCLVITNVLKYALPLARPPRIKHGLIVPGYSPGFPSAHTAFAFGLAWLVFVLKPRFSPLWFAMAVAVGWSRVEIRAHYPYQVICGAILGIAMAHLISASVKGITPNAMERWRNRKNPEAEKPPAAEPELNPDEPLPVTHP